MGFCECTPRIFVDKYTSFFLPIFYQLPISVSITCLFFMHMKIIWFSDSTSISFFWCRGFLSAVDVFFVILFRSVFNKLIISSGCETFLVLETFFKSLSLYLMPLCSLTQNILWQWIPQNICIYLSEVWILEIILNFHNVKALLYPLLYFESTFAYNIIILWIHTCFSKQLLIVFPLSIIKKKNNVVRYWYIIFLI